MVTFKYRKGRSCFSKIVKIILQGSILDYPHKLNVWPRFYKTYFNKNES